MSMKLRLIYSPNMGFKKRRKNQIKFIIFHYTGMKSEKLAINKLTNLQSGVSSHYLIKKSGEIVLMVPDLYTAWHAGISAWKRYKLLNANSIGIDFLSTPFDADAIDFLDPLVPFHKISSSDITNTPFLRHIASKKKPVVLSTGASTLSEIEHALDILYSNVCPEYFVY